MPKVPLRALLFTFAVTLLPIFARAQAQTGSNDLSAAAQAEREALIAGGYPLFDTAGLLSSEDREALLGLLVHLQDCCDLTISLVLQDQPRNASAGQDLDVLLHQLQRTHLWTDQSLTILLQSNPREALAIRAADVSGRTQSLGPQELQALGFAAADGRAGQALIQALNALSTNLDAENFSLVVWTLGRSAQEALYHLSTFLIFAGLFIALFWAMRRRQTLPDPLCLRGIGVRLPPFSPMTADQGAGFASGAHVLFIRQRRAPRHGLSLLILSLVVGFSSLIVMEPAFVGLETFWEQRRLWIFADYWPARACLSLGVTLCLFMILLTSPLGAWMTPGRLAHRRQARLLAQCLQSYAHLNRVTLIFVWRQISGRLEVWEPAHATLANPRMDSLLDRLDADLTHGEGEVGMKRFLDQYDRLLQMRGASDKPGEIQTLRI